MAYNIKLFVHGVPNGQDIWGTLGADAKYIEAFYGRKSNVASQMILEVMRFGGETNAYYTYFYYNDKIQDKQNRTGGYFALTLRINYYYADVQNIYNLLEAAFNKYIIGSTLEYTAGGGCRFLVAQLNQENKTYMALEKELEHYLMQFSSNKDFVSLVGFKCNGQNECGTINLLEAASNVVLSHVKSTGKISVSSLHPTSKEQQIINKMKSEVQATNQNAQQQISSVKQKAQQDVQAAQRDKEQGIQAVKDQYKDADQTISQLRAEVNKKNTDITNLSAQVKDLNQKLQNAQAYKTHYEESQKRLKKYEEDFAETQKCLSNLNEIYKLVDIPSVGSNVNGKGREGRKCPKEPEVGSSGFASFVKNIHPFLDFFVMLVLLLIIGLTLPKSCENNDAKGNKEEENEQVDSPNGEVPEIDGEQDPADDSDSSYINSLRARYPHARIDVSNINEAKGQYIRKSSGENYAISLKGIDEDLHGEWGCDSNDFHIYNDIIIPLRAGDYKISYKVDGIVFLERTLRVIE